MKTVDNVTAGSVGQPPLSIPSLLILWGGLFLLIQQVERFFLFPTTLSIETPTVSFIIKTFAAGLAQDLAVAGGALAVGTVLALPIGLVARLFVKHRTLAVTRKMFANCLKAPFGLIALTLTVIMMVDMSYYHFSHQRLNFVFFEYVADFLSAPVTGTQESQAAQQTAAELENMKAWGMQACGFLFLEGLILLTWWRAFHRLMSQEGTGWTVSRSFASKVGLAVVVVIGAMGASPHSAPIKPWIESDTYFMLAQNPVLFSKGSAYAALFHQWAWVPQAPDKGLSVDDAVGLYQSSRGQRVVFPYQRYPFVGQGASHDELRFRDPPNVLVIFVEGLDRRYMGQTVDADRPIRVTPFLDDLKQQSLYFNNFFSNGVQTSRGLFATLCSYYPRQGAAAIKTRST
ncbi:MAG TPA: sulfatase-like hydrolase/transferase, partial [Nitrospira sp.]|nr:sulfatase-like hydrolase/transferase [Nitrospira sp.]